MDVMNLFRNEKAVRYAKEEVIFNEGEHGNAMYVVLDGEVNILSGDNTLETVSPGGIFGEMALTGNEERSATAVAKTNCAVAAIDEKRFSFLIQNTPHFAIQVMKVMASRLRRQTRFVTSEADS